MATYRDLLKYAATGQASPSMTYYDKMRASTLMGGAVKTLTGIPPLSFKADGKPLTSVTIKGNGVQNGTPSPQNIVPFDGTGERTGNLLDIKDGTNTINSVVWTAYHGTITGQGTTTAAAASDTVIVYDGTFTRSGNYINYCRIQASKSIKPPAGTYTFSANADLSSKDAVALIVGDNDTYYANSTARKIAVGETFSVNGDEYVMLVVSSSTSKSQYNFADIMLNSGSTALPYEPYGWMQKITCAGQTTPVYLGQVQTVRRIKKLVLTGKESWSLYGSGLHFQITVDNQAAGRSTFIPISNTFNGIQVTTWDELQNGDFSFSPTQRSTVRFRYDAYEGNLAGWKSYLSAQYEAGTPVTVWYVLATPQIGIVNEPLAKIGDYADELHSEDAAVTIPTAKGDNTLTVDTPIQPSEMTITYKG